MVNGIKYWYFNVSDLSQEEIDDLTKYLIETYGMERTTGCKFKPDYIRANAYNSKHIMHDVKVSYSKNYQEIQLSDINWRTTSPDTSASLLQKVKTILFG